MGAARQDRWLLFAGNYGNRSGLELETLLGHPINLIHQYSDLLRLAPTDRLHLLDSTPLPLYPSRLLSDETGTLLRFFEHARDDAQQLFDRVRRFFAHPWPAAPARSLIRARAKSRHAPA